MSSEYPRDEFDDVPENSDRQGVHRERLAKQRGSGLGLIILVAALVLIIGVISALVFPRLGIGGAPTAGQTPPADQQTSSPAATDTAQPTTPETTPPAEEETPPAEETTPPETPAVDKTVPLVVYNATLTQGLGTVVSTRVTQDGWTVNSVTNWPGNPLDTSYVFYPREDLAPSAQALADLLGIQQILLDPSFGDTIAVVAGPGYQG